MVPVYTIFSKKSTKIVISTAIVTKSSQTAPFTKKNDPSSPYTTLPFLTPPPQKKNTTLPFLYNLMHIKPYCHQAQLACACPEKLFLFPRTFTPLIIHPPSMAQAILAPIGHFHHTPYLPQNALSPFLYNLMHIKPFCYQAQLACACPERVIFISIPPPTAFLNHLSTKRTLLALAPIGLLTITTISPSRKNTPDIVLLHETPQTILLTNAIYRICPCASRTIFIRTFIFSFYSCYEHSFHPIPQTRLACACPARAFSL